SIGDHATQLPLIGLISHYALTELPLSLFRLRRQNMPGKRMSTHYFTRAGLFEALGRAFVCFQLRHSMSWISYRTSSVALFLVVFPLVGPGHLDGFELAFVRFGRVIAEASEPGDPLVQVGEPYLQGILLGELLV